MARREALIRLNKSLLARRADLTQKLADDLHTLRENASDSTGDAADAAFEASGEEMASHLAELDSRELSQIERALHRLKQGTYGLCESCSEKIPVGRLNALPYTTMCIECQREMERYPGGWDYGHDANWERAFNAARPIEEQRELDLSQIELGKE